MMRPFIDSKADQDKKLFIGGLSPKTDENSLKNYYGQWGEIIDVVVMKDPRSQKSRGFGFVTYKDSSSVDAAQNNRPHTVDGKEVDTKRAMPREETSPEVHAAVKKIFVGALKKDVTNEDLNAVDKVILARPHTIKDSKADVRKALSREEMNKMRSKPAPMRADYNGGGWHDNANGGFQPQSWEQGYSQPYAHQQPYAYNGGGYGYGGYDGGCPAGGWPNASDGFGNYQQQGYGGGPMRATPATAQYPRPAPYSGNGWQQR
ncbi:putative heterogeneous nuclear ribonucleoprotein [Schistosoma mansoni]|uniref:putative heterogeneous nuclear ribonucleoprotein n=1 Tax=Schistosoma mansoni TaxID=6183 RepID=UPI00022DC0F2|nr:putative heterogeneous nuclear ribonucleoprotein [Schistosoma mansoni]|eukprot:XP_018651973.1 putative heterogeneous nuclear ribonucleoprotein [Schistosoma mansoni]